MPQAMPRMPRTVRPGFMVRCRRAIYLKRFVIAFSLLPLIPFSPVIMIEVLRVQHLRHHLHETGVNLIWAEAIDVSAASAEKHLELAPKTRVVAIEADIREKGVD